MVMQAFKMNSTDTTSLALISPKYGKISEVADLSPLFLLTSGYDHNFPIFTNPRLGYYKLLADCGNSPQSSYVLK